MGALDLDTGFMHVAPQMSVAAVVNQFVTFSCGDRSFGLDIMSVREIRSWSAVTVVPGQAHGALGVLDIRGKIVEVYDLATLIDAYGDRETVNRVVIVVSLGARELGVVVDTVSDIIFANADDMRPPPRGKPAREASVSALINTDGRLIAILNLAALFPDEF